MREVFSEQLAHMLTVGAEYGLEDIARLLGMQFQAVKGKGVIPKANTDTVVILVTLEKEKSAVQYFDRVDGSTLFWSGQNKLRTVENYLEMGEHSFFAFIKQRKGLPYTYCGRVVPLRIQKSNVYGVPSRIVFDMYEYHAAGREDEYCLGEDEIGYGGKKETERIAVQRIRTMQGQYRERALALWDNKCAITSVDDKGWLIASHIKPWRESTASERIDPRNSLILTPNYDKLFDRGVISFSPDNGRIKLPDVLPRELWMNLTRLGIDDKIELRNVPEGTDRYLRYHNENVFNFTPKDGLTTSEFVEELLVKALS